MVRQPRVLAARACKSDRMNLMEIPPMLSEVLQSCDGRKEVHEIASLFCSNHAETDGVPPEEVCRLSLELLRQERLIGFSRPAAPRPA